MTQYIYTGPLSGVSLKDCGDFMLIPGAVVTLPDHGYTDRLKRKGWLTEVKQAEPETVESIDEVTENKRRK